MLDCYKVSIMLLVITVLTNLILTAAEVNLEPGYCDRETKSCENYENFHDDSKVIFYDVNPAEGFNLRRDVYMRFAIMASELRKSGKKPNWMLVLPPWHNLYHWRTETNKRKPKPWGMFFDIESLKTFAPVVELHEIFCKTLSKTLEIDTLYVLQNYDNPFENGEFKDKWEVSSAECDYDGQFWGYSNVTAKEIICIKFQGRISMLNELILLHPTDKRVMFAHGEIPLHDNYGTKTYWDCRKSMRFNNRLQNIALKYIKEILNCATDKCLQYMSIHWRRQDFARGRSKDVPSTKGTAKQIDEAIKKNIPQINNIFIASDASQSELKQLETELIALDYKVHYYLPSKQVIDTYKDGGVAIIEQIICTHSAYFIGTHESTFSYRIQEEREILGFDSKTTFNRLCPDTGACERPSKWTIVN